MTRKLTTKRARPALSTRSASSFPTDATSDANAPASTTPEKRRESETRRAQIVKSAKSGGLAKRLDAVRREVARGFRALWANWRAWALWAAERLGLRRGARKRIPRSGERFEDFSEDVEKQLPNPKDRLGRDGERLAFEYFRSNPNFRVFACNVATPFCEIDLLGVDLTTGELTFVEVKTRRRESEERPTLGAVDARRRRKIALASNVLAVEYGEENRPRRFDVFVVIWPEDGAPASTHYKNFFQRERALLGYWKNNFRRGRPKNGDSPG